METGTLSALPWALPWVGLLLFLIFGVRLPRPLPSRGREDGPRVSVIIPARNEARNIGRVVDSLASSTYQDLEILVIDDRSEDGTGELAREAGRAHPGRVRVVRGEPLPEGWMGKNWACHQGAMEASGRMLLFTDADTWHAPELVGRSVAALDEDEADCVSLSGRQLMESFWERLVQPHVFTAMLARYPRLRWPLPPKRWRGAIANGQYILIPRDVYDEMGGHEALKGEVVEDLRMAQRLVRRGKRLSIRMAEEAFTTRMYTSLSELVEGWSKNVVLGGMATLPPWIRGVAPLLILLTGLVLWVAPPVAGVLALMGIGGSAVLTWAAAAVGTSVVLWCAACWRMGAPVSYGFLYPLGSLVTGYIFARAWRRGGTVEWKGRQYALKTETLRREP
ncbi:MAG: glycosyltransferase family 2 protein [Gemmatimonadota bacterium]